VYNILRSYKKQCTYPLGDYAICKLEYRYHTTEKRIKKRRSFKYHKYAQTTIMSCWKVLKNWKLNIFGYLCSATLEVNDGSGSPWLLWNSLVVKVSHWFILKSLFAMVYHWLLRNSFNHATAASVMAYSDSPLCVCLCVRLYLCVCVCVRVCVCVVVYYKVNLKIFLWKTTCPIST
jgi:hypothetical protein